MTDDADADREIEELLRLGRPQRNKTSPKIRERRIKLIREAVLGYLLQIYFEGDEDALRQIVSTVQAATLEAMMKLREIAKDEGTGIVRPLVWPPPALSIYELGLAVDMMNESFANLDQDDMREATNIIRALNETAELAMEIEGRMGKRRGR